ncbi:MAG: hypothetical protein QXQ39_00350 [Conexivisphaerales archaeon]
MSSGPDIREKVKESRGTVKKLELLIPGLRGYRKLEDIRASDELLRNEVADRLDKARNSLDSIRKKMVDAGDFANLSAIASAMSRLQQLSGQVRHSEQGYSGIAANIRVDEDTLNRLYDFDSEFVSSAFNLADFAAQVVYQQDTIQSNIASINSMIDEFKQKWMTRIENVEDIIVR